MATDQVWQSNFKQRCEAVGWTVEQASGSSHYKVRDAKGKLLLTYSNTPGDRRSMLNVLSQAKRAGLEDLEKLVKLRDERDRLERIEKDREANAARTTELEATLERAVLFQPPPSNLDLTKSQVNLGQVDGVAIVAVAPAKVKTPAMATAMPLADGEELLLADDRVVYRCTKPAATPRRPELTGVCHRTYENVNSLLTHIGYHTRKLRDREDAAVPAQAQVNGSVTPDATPESHKSHSEFQALDHALAQLQLGIERVAESFSGLIIETGTLRDAVRRLPQVDPEVVEKAKRFDALRGFLKD